MPTPGVYICIRRTLDWHDEAATAARSGRTSGRRWRLERDPDPPYHLFRHRLKQIAQTNLALVETAIQAPLERSHGVPS
jgi:hypothetical protein